MISSQILRSTLPITIDAVCVEGKMYTDQFQPTLEWDYVLQGFPVSGHWLFLEVVKERIVGWCRLFPAEEGELELGIGLLKSYRNQGRGTRMVRQALRWAKAQGYRRVVLSTRMDNEVALHVFTKCGFVLTGQGEGAWCYMVYDLSSGKKEIRK